MRNIRSLIAAFSFGRKKENEKLFLFNIYNIISECKNKIAQNYILPVSGKQF